MQEITLQNENTCSITGNKYQSIVVCKFCKVRLDYDGKKNKSKS
jgi:hypothetical protein